MARRCLLIAWFIATALGGATAVSADVVMDVRVGWQNRFRPERWTPVVVTAQADDVTPVLLRWYVPRPGRESMIIEQAVTLNPKAGDHFAYLPIGPDPAAVHLTVSDARDGRTLAFWPTDAVPPMAYADAQVRQPVFIGVSGEGPALGRLDASTFSVAYLPPAHLPPHPIGYDGLDVLALNEPQIAEIGQERQQAIVSWVRAGGSLLMWLDLQALPEDSPLVSLIPGGGVEEFTSAQLGGETVAYTRLRTVTDGRLVTRQPVGLGEVVFLHVRPELALQAGVEFLSGEPGAAAVTYPVAPADAVAAASDAAETGLPLPIGLLAIAVLVGPVDWLILRQNRRRMRRWLTLPGWLAVFALLIWYLPTDPAERTWTAVAPESETAPPAARATIASTGIDLAGTDEQDIARLRTLGPTFWRTIGFDRTQGPLRDIRFHQGPDGMSTDSRRPALIVEGHAFAE